MSNLKIVEHQLNIEWIKGKKNKIKERFKLNKKKERALLKKEQERKGVYNKATS